MGPHHAGKIVYICVPSKALIMFIFRRFFLSLCCWMFAPLWVVLKKSEKRKFNVADTKKRLVCVFNFFSSFWAFRCNVSFIRWRLNEKRTRCMIRWFCAIYFLLYFLFILCVWHFFYSFESKCARDEEIVRHFVFFTMGFWFLSRSFLCAAFITRNPQVLIVMHRNVTPLLRRRMKIMTQRQITRRQLIHWLATPVLATLISLNSALFSISCSLILRA